MRWFSYEKNVFTTSKDIMYECTSKINTKINWTMLNESYGCLMFWIDKRSFIWLIRLWSLPTRNMEDFYASTDNYLTVPEQNRNRRIFIKLSFWISHALSKSIKTQKAWLMLSLHDWAVFICFFFLYRNQILFLSITKSKTRCLENEMYPSFLPNYQKSF